MIKKIYCSELDRNNLSRRKVSIIQEPDTFDYQNIVVKKPWGYEYLMFQNEYVAIWILYLKKNHGTSMHCHPQKKTSLIVLSGEVEAATLQEWFNFSRLDGATYDKGVFHTTKALTNDAFVMEIESPVNKKDLVRLKDNYGRENKGYEDETQMSKNLKRFEHVFFDQQAIKARMVKKIKNTSLSIKKCQTVYLQDEIIHTDESKLHCLLHENAVINNHPLFGVGNFFHYNHLQSLDPIKLTDNALMLSLE